MIKNVILDMGNVLIKYDPDFFIRREGISGGPDYELLMKNIFKSPEWGMMDMGVMDESMMEKKVLSVLPQRLHGVAHRLIFEWDNPIIPISGMEDFVRDCRNVSLGVYLLSNASVRQPEYWKYIPGHELFCGTLVSAFVKKVKPDKSIYTIASEKFGIVPSECIFVDDMASNVRGAEEAGMSAFLFTGDVGALRKAVFK